MKYQATVKLICKLERQGPRPMTKSFILLTLIDILISYLYVYKDMIYK